MKDCKRRKIIGAEIVKSGDSQFDQRGAEVSPRHQQLHQQNRICIRKLGPQCGSFAPAIIDRERVATWCEREDREVINSQHLVVIEMSETAQQTLGKPPQPKPVFLVNPRKKSPPSSPTATSPARI